MRKSVRAVWAWVAGGRRFAVGGAAVMLAAGLIAYAVSGAFAASSASQRPGGPGRSEKGAVLPLGPALPGTGAPLAAAARPLPPISTVTLVTGQRVRLSVTPGGQQSVGLAGLAANGAAGSASGQFTEFAWGGDEYLIPDEVIPSLGSVLDMRLFDISYLVRARLDDAHSTSLPVTISYTGEQEPVNLPGVHITRTSGASATATVSKAQAPQLGRLLASKWESSRAGRHATEGPLPGIARILLAQPPGAPPLPADPQRSPAAAATQATPAQAGPRGTGLVWHTLTLRFTDLNGNPALALGLVQNVDNLSLSTFFAIGQGSYAVSVPAGTYSIAFNVLTPDASGTPFRAALVVKPQVTVGADETLTFDARTAKPFRAGLATSPPGDSDRSEFVSFTRSSEIGGDFPVGTALLTVSGSENDVVTDLFATPTAPVTKGTFDFDAASVLYDPTPSAGNAPPRYFFVFPHPGSIPSSLSYTVPRSGLTAVHEHIYASASGASLPNEWLSPLVDLSWGDRVDTGLITPAGNDPATSSWPGNRTDYWYSSLPALTVWQNQLLTDDFGTFGSRDILGRHWVISPGQQISEVWNKAPQAPPPVAEGAQFEFSAEDTGTVCEACRQGDIGMLYPSPDGDSDPYHYDDIFGAATALSFYRDGTLAITSDALPQPANGVLYQDGFELPLLPRAATYELRWTSNVRTADPAAVTTTNWTFRSGPADPAADLPHSEQCSPDPSQRCSFLPLLYLTYDLALNPQSQATAGRPFQIAFTVEHQQNQPPPAGVSATVSASFDNGKTWSPAQPASSEGGGRFTATISQPPLSATSGFASLRVTARDGAGNAVTQTIIEAYGLTS
jgi:hypothetical protein